MRSVFLPARGDPFVLQMSFYLFDHVWQDEVDKLYLTTNGTVEKEVVDFIRGQAAKNPKIVYDNIPYDTDHGTVLGKMLDKSTEDYIMLAEDDGFCYGKGAIDRCFKMIESGEYDMVGSPKWQNTNKFKADAIRHLKLTPQEEIEGAGFWSTFFFVKRSDVMKTDRHFGSIGWNEGDYIKPIDCVAEARECADVNMWMSVQLRDLGLKPYILPPIDDRFRPEFPFLHTGSLSGFMLSTFTDDRDIPLFKRKFEIQIPAIHTELPIPKSMFEKKFAWITLCLRKFENEFLPIDEFKKEYIKSMHKYGDKFGIDWHLVESYSREYEVFMGI